MSSLSANKIVLNGDVLIDLTEDTITETDVLNGKTFHKADGSIAHGNVRWIQDIEITPDRNTWTYESKDGNILKKVIINPIPDAYVNNPVWDMQLTVTDID